MMQGPCQLKKMPQNRENFFASTAECSAMRKKSRRFAVSAASGTYRGAAG
jgi:hypothetical protein